MNITLLALYNVNSYAIRGLHALLKQNKHKAKSIYFKNSIYTDAIYTDREIWGLMDLIGYTEAEILAVSVHSPLYPLFKIISRSVRKRFPNCKIVVGGDHPTAMPDECLEYADWVVAGEGEYPMLDIANGYADEGIVIGKQLFDLDDLPLPTYGFDSYLYNSHPMHRGLKLSWFASRGCKYNCTYCQETVRKNVFQSEIRSKSVDKVAEELDYLMSIFPGINVVTFSDAIFPYDTDWLSDFASYFKRLGKQFWCSTNAALITKDAMKLLKMAGCTFLRFGVQSGSKKIREEIFERSDELEQIVERSQEADNLGLRCEFDFITQYPYETAETLKETRNFIDKLPRYSQINHFEMRWFPKTPFTERVLKDGFIEPKDVEGNFIRIGNWSYSYIKA